MISMMPAMSTLNGICRVQPLMRPSFLRMVGIKTSYVTVSPGDRVRRCVPERRGRRAARRPPGQRLDFSCKVCRREPFYLAEGEWHVRMARHTADVAGTTA